MRTVIRICCLVGVAFGLYKTDLESVLAFVALMGIVFWAIPETCMFIARQGKEDET